MYVSQISVFTYEIPLVIKMWRVTNDISEFKDFEMTKLHQFSVLKMTEKLHKLPIYKLVTQTRKK